MKLFNYLMLSSSILAFSLSSCNSLNKKVSLKSEIDSVSYAIGVNVGQSLKEGPGLEDLNMRALMVAIDEIFSEKETKMSHREANEYLNIYFNKLRQQEAIVNLEEGNAFLDANKEEEGIIVTESGLQYEVLKKGDGPKPVKGDKVKVHYHGTLIDGTVFDSSKERGKPFEYVTGVGRVIKGWEEIIPMMNVGSVYKIYVPTHLAYGVNVRQGGAVKSNMALIFEIELLDIVPQEK